MATKKVQVGWEFVGSNVVASTGYRKEYFFPPNVSISMSRRGNGWNDSEEEALPDQVFDVSARTGSSWDFKDNGKIAEKFEVMQIERIGGKITTTIILPKPYIAEVDIEDEVEEVE